jgi:integrase
MMEHLDNPARGVKQFRERSRDRFLKPEELKRFFISIGEEPNQNIPDFLLIALFTGARRANVLAMKWGDIDFSLGTWTIRAEESKNREPMTIPLVAPVVEILLRRKQLARSIFVFPGSGKAGHLVEPKSGWTRIIHRAGLKDVRIHDLRRTLGSFQAIGGASTAIIGKSLGHKNPQSTSIYSRLSLDPVRKSVEAAVELMQTSAEASAQSQVVDIRKGR